MNCDICRNQRVFIKYARREKYRDKVRKINREKESDK